MLRYKRKVLNCREVFTPGNKTSRFMRQRGEVSDKRHPSHTCRSTFFPLAHISLLFVFRARRKASCKHRITRERASEIRGGISRGCVQFLRESLRKVPRRSCRGGHRGREAADKVFPADAAAKSLSRNPGLPRDSRRRRSSARSPLCYSQTHTKLINTPSRAAASTGRTLSLSLACLSSIVLGFIVSHDGNLNEIRSVEEAVAIPHDFDPRWKVKPAALSLDLLRLALANSSNSSPRGVD